MSDLSPQERSILQRVLARPELQDHFFRKVRQLKWFDAIIDAGFLDPDKNPKPVKIEEDYYNIPNWPVTNYLVSAAELLIDDVNNEYSGKFIDTLKKVTFHARDTGFSNYRTWWQFVKVIRQIPIEHVHVEDLEMVRFWIQDEFDRVLVVEEIGKWIQSILDSNADESSDIVLKLFDILFQIRGVAHHRFPDRPVAAFFFKGYQIDRVASAITRNAGQTLGESFVDLMVSKMRQVIDIQGGDQWTAIWCPAVEDHEQNLRRLDAKAVILKAVREALLGFFETQSMDASSQKLLEIMAPEYPTLTRICIFVASEYFENLTEEIRARILAGRHFDDPFRHELWWFLNRNYNRLNDEQKRSVISMIEDIEILDNDNTPKAIPTAYSKLLWLSAIHQQGNKAADLYNDCLAIAGKPPEHPDFSSYSTSLTVTHESPIKLAELRSLAEDPQALVNYLNECEYAGYFNGPDLIGLGVCRI